MHGCALRATALPRSGVPAAQAAGSTCERIEALAQALAAATERDTAELSALLDQSRSQLAQLRRGFRAGAAPRARRGWPARGPLQGGLHEGGARDSRGREALARAELEACAARARLCGELEHRVLGNGADDARPS
jgi:hypothetical protein